MRGQPRAGGHVPARRPPAELIQGSKVEPHPWICQTTPARPDPARTRRPKGQRTGSWEDAREPRRQSQELELCFSLLSFLFCFVFLHLRQRRRTKQHFPISQPCFHTRFCLRAEGGMLEPSLGESTAPPRKGPMSSWLFLSCGPPAPKSEASRQECPTSGSRLGPALTPAGACAGCRGIPRVATKPVFHITGRFLDSWRGTTPRPSAPAQRWPCAPIPEARPSFRPATTPPPPPRRGSRPRQDGLILRPRELPGPAHPRFHEQQLW